MRTWEDPWAGTDKMDKRPHPAKFSDSILNAMGEYLPDSVKTICDPMAGVRKIVNFFGDKYLYDLCELEKEWFDQIPNESYVRKSLGDALFHKIRYGDGDVPEEFCFVTSPPYGNRMADFFVSQTKPQSMRGRYAGDLGRRLSEGSTASLRFGGKYMELTERIYSVLTAQAPVGSFFVLNCSNFIRDRKEQNVVGAYLRLMGDVGYTLRKAGRVGTPRLGGVGANWDLRVDGEFLGLFQKIEQIPAPLFLDPLVEAVL